MCTTTHFDGIIAVVDPETSWVARWQRVCTYTPVFLVCGRISLVDSSEIRSWDVRGSCQRADTRRRRGRAGESRDQVPAKRPDGNGLRVPLSTLVVMFLTFRRLSIPVF